MAEAKAGKSSCFKTILLIALLVLVVLLVVSFTLSSLFDLGVWDEFWDLVAEKYNL